LQRKNVILPIAKQVAALLEEQGVQAVMTRDSDYFIGLGSRVARGRWFKGGLVCQYPRQCHACQPLMSVVWRRITMTVVGVWLGRSTTLFCGV